MKTFSKRSDRIIPSSSMAGAEKIQQAPEGMEIINMTWGQPDFDTPDHIKQAAIKAVRDGKNGYTPSLGILELREAIAEMYESRYRARYNPESEIIVTPGAKQGLMYLMQLLINPGDEVIIFEPCWLSYRDMIYLNEGVPSFIKSKYNFTPDVNALESAITPASKMILINNPINPSGYVLKKNELKIIISIAEKYDLYIIADEIYDRIAFTDFVSISEFSGLKNRMVIVNGFSKTYAMTGWRIGYMLGPENIISKINLIHQHTATCASSQSQYAGLAAIEGDQSEVEEMVMSYKRRRDLIAKLLENSPFNILLPEGTFYALMRLPDINKMDMSPADYLLKSYGIATVDGSAYGKSTSHAVRLCLTIGMDTIEKVASRLQTIQ